MYWHTTCNIWLGVDVQQGVRQCSLRIDPGKSNYLPRRTMNVVMVSAACVLLVVD